MSKKLLIFIIILIALLGFYFVYNYFTKPEVKAPTIENDGGINNVNEFPAPSRNESAANTGFKGPTGPPHIKGPSGPPSMRE